MEIAGNIVDPVNEEIYGGRILIENGLIKEIKRDNQNYQAFLVPGFIDAHIHIESSMLSPAQFGNTAIKHGTTTVIADPHEIANVLGIQGIDFMIEDSKHAPLKIFFTAPSCVPATQFETSGAEIGTKEIGQLMSYPEIVGLAEVMNFPAVISQDPEIMQKINVAKNHNKPIDGHCPGLYGQALQNYINAGISTDHECTTLKEAQEKASQGMKIMIREGSSAKNMESLINLARHQETMFVSDDLSASDLSAGHINVLLKKAVALGLNPFRAIKAATINPAQHYNLNSGAIKPGYAADIVEINNLTEFKPSKVIINGKLIAKNGSIIIFPNKGDDGGVTPVIQQVNGDDGGVTPVISQFQIKFKTGSDLTIYTPRQKAKVRVIQAREHSLITQEKQCWLKTKQGQIMPDPEQDILKIAVVERHGHNRIGLGFVSGFGLKQGAIASSVSHDSHNIVCVGTNNKDMVQTINQIINMQGGLSAAHKSQNTALALPIAGLMSNKRPEKISKKIKQLNQFIKTLGCPMDNPFATLSFMALLVIPEIKISDKGLFNTTEFQFTNLIIDYE